MTRYGYFLSSEESSPAELVRQARLAEDGTHVDAGFDEVYINQVGSGQAGFFEFYAGQVLPRLREA
ncbi:MAG: hypothetical protein ABSB76_14980 [Streptosporangiaceae bacterium]|jgi:hypothetical protein